MLMLLSLNHTLSCKVLNANEGRAQPPGVEGGGKGLLWTFLWNQNAPGREVANGKTGED